MKRKTLFILLLLTTMAAGAQTINVHKTDGTVVTYPSADVEYIDFTAKEDNVPPYTSCPDANHPHWIDLGLPSGTLWACCNVGANAPEGYGNFYAWGETQPKEVYSWDTYQYVSDRGYKVNIGSDIAGTSYDAATANWGAPWCMPSQVQCLELISKCSSTWTMQNGVNGRKFTSPNGGAIFLPVTGYSYDGMHHNAGCGYYWLSTHDESIPGGAYGLVIKPEAPGLSYGDCLCGKSVRPVR